MARADYVAIAWRLLLLLASLALAGCLGAGADMRVLEDFSADPRAAVQKYREVWSAYEPGDVSDERMFIASEMMRFDLDRREAYYRFIVDHVRKDDGAYRPSALRALGYATGTESLEILFQAYESREDAAAREAFMSIKLRYESAKAVGNSSEMAFVKKRSSEALKRVQAPQSTHASGS